MQALNNLRREAYDFLEGKVEPVGSLQHSFQRDIMDGSLHFFIQDINQFNRVRSFPSSYAFDLGGRVS